jgi:hypothetical protein
MEKVFNEQKDQVLRLKSIIYEIEQNIGEKEVAIGKVES